MAAFLLAQLEEAQAITADRMASWNHYHDAPQGLVGKGLLRRPCVPQHCQHNAHMYHVALEPGIGRERVLDAL